MLKLTAKDKIKLACSGFTVEGSDFVISLNGVNVKLSVHTWLDDPVDVLFDVYFDDALNVPVVILDNYKIPLFGKITYKNFYVYPF